MKRVSLLLVILILGIALSAGPAGSQKIWAVDPKMQIVTTLPILKDITAKIGGNQVAVRSIIQGIACAHEYEPSARDMTLLAKTAVFIKIGMGSDAWADKLAAGVLTPKTRVVDASQGIKVLKVHGIENPHYWGDPENVKHMAKNILKSLISVRPNQKGYFTANYKKLIQEIDQTVAELKKKTAKVSGKPFVSYTNSFPYFYAFFGFKNIATVEVNCEQEVSPKDLAKAAQLIKSQKIRILIGDAAEPKEPAGLAKETGAKVLLLWAMTDESGDYLKTLRRNVEMLVKALQ